MTTVFDDDDEELKQFGYVRTWLEKDESDIHQLIGDIGWIVGSDSKGRTLYHYSKSDARQLVISFLAKRMARAL